MTREEEAAAVEVAVRIAVTGTLCLFFSEWLALGQRSISVYTAHLAMAMFPYSAFQKALERLVGRVLGVAYGMMLVELFSPSPILLVVLMLLGQMVFFYVNASGRFAYSTLMGGLFLGVIVEMGLTSAPGAQNYAIGLVEQLVLGAAMITVVNWVSGAERTLAIEPGGHELWPPRAEWVSKGAMVSTGQVLAMFAAWFLQVPPLPTMISATILALTTNDLVSMTLKGYQRALGAILGGGYALASLILLDYVPEFPLLLVLNFFGMFLAAYYCKASVKYSYTFLQMGLVMPMVLIGPDGGMGHFDLAVQRLVGIAAGLAIAEFVFLCWPRFVFQPA